MNMINMKKYFLVTTILILAMSKSFAASIQPYTPYPSAKGIIIITSDAVKNANKIDLKRREAGKNWQNIASFFPVTDLSSFASNFERAKNFVPTPVGFQKVTATIVWDAYSKLSIGDSLKWVGGFIASRIALGYAFFDSTAKPNVNYEYEIISSSGSDKTTAAVSFPGRSDYGTLKRDTSFSDGKFIETIWKAKTNVRAFNVEVYRGHNYSKDFKRIYPDFWIEKSKKKDTTIFYHIKDTAVFQSQIYRYVLIPVDQFGAQSKPSDTMICNSLNLISMSVIQQLHVGNIEAGGGIMVSWKTDFSDDLMGYNVFRSEESDKNFKMVSFIPSTDTAYLDYNAEMMKPYYYYVEPVTVTSIKLPRSATAFGMYQEKLKPEAPVIIGAFGINNGVQLDFQMVEKTISGYRVYRNSKDDSTMQLISGLLPVRDAHITYMDTAASLAGGFIYTYKVRAENESQVQSDFSKPVQAAPLKKTKPNAIACKTKLELGRVFLKWESDTLNTSVLSFEIWRREVSDKTENKFSPLEKNALDGKSRMYVDTTIEIGKTYEYAVTCNDRFGGKSEITYTSVIDIPLSKTVSPSEVNAVPMSDGILISWSIVFEDGLKNYNVYRYEKGAKPQLLGTISSTEKNLSYKDSSASKGKMYFYYITTTNNSGAESTAVTEAGVKY